MDEKQLAQFILDHLDKEYQEHGIYDAAYIYDDEALDSCGIDGHVDLIKLSEAILQKLNVGKDA